MVVRRVDVADPKEGKLIAKALRAAGFDVRERSVDSLRGGTDAALVVMAGDAAEAPEVLFALHQSAGTGSAPLVLIGEIPTGASQHRIVSTAGAGAIYSRPVPVGRLVERVSGFLSAELKKEGLDGSSETPHPLVEPTMQLDDRMSVDTSSPGSSSARSSRADASAGAGASSYGRSPVGNDPAEPRAPDMVGPGAEISPGLERLFSDADRRLFPDASPLDLRFPGGDESADELVPDDLIESFSSPTEIAEEEGALDGFPYAGPSPEGVAAASPPPGGTSSVNPGSGERKLSELQSDSAAKSARVREGSGEADSAPGSGPHPVEVVDASFVGSVGDFRRLPTSQARGRLAEAPTLSTECGELGPGGLVSFLWNLVREKSDACVRFERNDSLTVELVLVGGSLFFVHGPVALRVCERMRQAGRMVEHADDENVAVGLLERAVHAGLLGRLELERAFRKAREELLFELMEAVGVRYEVRPVGSQSAVVRASPLSAPLMHVLVEGARSRVLEELLFRLRGARALELQLSPDWAAVRGETGVEPEVCLLLEHFDGKPLVELLAEGSPADGLAGLVYALEAMGALRLVITPGDEAASPRSVEAVRRTVHAAFALAEEGDYFDILGVSMDARPREMGRAYHERREELARLPLSALGLEGLEEQRAIAIDALDEAYSILTDDRLCRVYRGALELLR